MSVDTKADGTLVSDQVERLEAMGDWLRINGEAIYGSRYWKESGQEDEHLAFTTRGKNLYAIKLAKPLEPFTITATKGWDASQVSSVRLLGTDVVIQWDMAAEGLQITPPADLGESLYAWSFEIVTDAEQHHPKDAK